MEPDRRTLPHANICTRCNHEQAADEPREKKALALIPEPTSPTLHRQAVHQAQREVAHAGVVVEEDKAKVMQGAHFVHQLRIGGAVLEALPHPLSAAWLKGQDDRKFVGLAGCEPWALRLPGR